MLDLKHETRLNTDRRAHVEEFGGHDRYSLEHELLDTIDRLIAECRELREKGDEQR